MCWDFRADYPCAAGSPAAARHFCTDALSGTLDPHGALPDLLADTAIVASELVTNSLAAGCTEISLVLTLHRDHLRLSVHDDAPGTPRLIHAGPRDLSGRGLAITAALSRAWGVEPTGIGKDVWAELSLDAAATSALHCTLFEVN